MKHLNVIKSFLVFLFVLIARALPHPANFSPVLGVAAYCGTKWSHHGYGFFGAVLGLFISDILFWGFEPISLWVYLGVGLTTWLGQLFQTQTKWKSVIFLPLLSSLIFFVVSNLGTWFIGNLYPLTWGGFLQCFILAIPFFKNTLISSYVFYLGCLGIEILVKQLQTKMVFKVS